MEKERWIEKMGNPESKIWYARQFDPEDCECGNGTFDYDEAIDWLSEAESEGAQIAVIEENPATGVGFCIDVIRKSDI